MICFLAPNEKQIVVWWQSLQDSFQDFMHAEEGREREKERESVRREAGRESRILCTLHMCVCRGCRRTKFCEVYCLVVGGSPRRFSHERAQVVKRGVLCMDAAMRVETQITVCQESPTWHVNNKGTGAPRPCLVGMAPAATFTHEQHAVQPAAKHTHEYHAAQPCTVCTHEQHAAQLSMYTPAHTVPAHRLARGATRVRSLLGPRCLQPSSRRTSADRVLVSARRLPLASGRHPSYSASFAFGVSVPQTK